MYAKSKCGKYAVNILQNGDGGGYLASALICDGQSYGGDTWWYRIGRYKSQKTAIRYAKLSLAEHGVEIVFGD